MVNVTVLTIAYRAGYIDTMGQALKAQTLSKDLWEWLLVDDRWADRHEAVADYIGDAFDYRHIPPREILPYARGGRKGVCDEQAVRLDADRPPDARRARNRAPRSARRGPQVRHEARLSVLRVFRPTGAGR